MTSGAPPSFAENFLTEIHQAICGTSKPMILLWYESAWISAKLRYCISPNPESLNCFGYFSVDSFEKTPFRVRSFPSAECSRVNHQCNSRNVNPTWCNIRCNQHTWRSCANDRVFHPRKNLNLKMNNSNNFEIENWEKESYKEIDKLWTQHCTFLSLSRTFSDRTSPVLSRSSETWELWNREPNPRIRPGLLNIFTTVYYCVYNIIFSTYSKIWATESTKPSWSFIEIVWLVHIAKLPTKSCQSLLTIMLLLLKVQRSASTS